MLSVLREVHGKGAREFSFRMKRYRIVRCDEIVVFVRIAGVLGAQVRSSAAAVQAVVEERP